MSPYLVPLILEFVPARLATQPHRLDSNVTQLLANLLTKPSVLYYLPIAFCNLVSRLQDYYYLLLNRTAMQGWERAIYTQSVRRLQPHNTNL